MRLVIYPIPCIPFPMIWIYIPIMKGEKKKEGLSPLLDTPDMGLNISKEGGEVNKQAPSTFP